MTELRAIVVGVGADGIAGLSPAAHAILVDAEVVIGSDRQLALLPAEVPARKIVWPTPMLPAVKPLLAEHGGPRTCVLASGDPMFFGVGTTLLRALGPGKVRVLPHPSSISLACAAMGWAGEETEVVSIVGRPLELVHLALAPGRRVLVLTPDAGGPAAVATSVTERGWGPSEMTVLENLGSAAERRTTATAGTWSDVDTAALNIVALSCAPAPGITPYSRTPGLPDKAFAHDGQLTKREVRALTVSALAPLPGELLWDVGAGAGSVGIEWMRTDRDCRAVAIESDPGRAERIGVNAAALGTPQLVVVTGAAPAALVGLPSPDAIFVGGGLTVDGVLESCVDALRPGGRLVANAVTVETEQRVIAAHAALGGELNRIELSRAAPLGGFTAWRAALPIVQWTLKL